MNELTKSNRTARTAGSGRPRSERALRSRAMASKADVQAVIDQPAPGKASRGPAGKLGIVVAMLARPEGATVAQISAATDWQPHSVRGAFAGALKKKHGLTIVSQPGEGGRVYRLGETDE